jgi:isopentenyl diphosphate isomerase/L-lactate dehydrogenase-like FMN-dependent dehydrogenase
MHQPQIRRPSEFFLSTEFSPSRRRFLKYLAASPLAASLPLLKSQDPFLPASPKEALDVLEFEAIARKNLPPAHFGYLATGVDDDATLRANREGFRKYQLRPRRMVDVSHADLSVDVLGTKWDTPLFICPCGSQKAFHPEGEMATAAAANTRKTLQVLSTMTTTPIEDVARANGKPIWYQLYLTSSWAVTEKLVARAEAAGCPVLAVTVDLTVGRNTETLERSKRSDTRQCTSCHPGGPQRSFARYSMFKGIETNGITTYNSAMSWDMIARLKKITKMKIVLKGIETREDARMSREYGADAIIVSNHGGRAEESGRGTIECLPEVIDGAGSMPVLIDGGFRRGTDIYKALALGAKGVGIGRPYLWALAAFGQPGVERVLDMLRSELSLTMRQLGRRSVAEIDRSSIIAAG